MGKLRERITGATDDIVDFFVETLTRASSRAGFMRYTHNTGWLFAGGVIALVFSFFIGLYVARYLGPADYGLLTYAASVTSIFAILVTFSQKILNRELVAHPEKRDALLGTAFVLRVFAAIFSITVIAIILSNLEIDSLTGQLIILYALILPLNLFGSIDIYFKSQVLGKRVFIVQTLSLVGVSIVKIICIVLGLGVIYFAWAAVLYQLLISIGFIIMYTRLGLSLFAWRYESSAAKLLAIGSWPILVASIAATINTNIANVILKHMMDTASVGLYAIATKLSDVWYFIPVAICTSLFPAIINAKKTDVTVYKKRVRNLYILLLLVSLFVALCITFFAGPILHIIFGGMYDDALGVLQIQIWRFVPYSILIALGHYLVAEDFITISMYGVVIGAVVSSVLTFSLIPLYGIPGASIASIVAVCVEIVAVLLFVSFKKRKELIVS